MLRKVIAAMNMSLDGFCDHTLGHPDEEIHEHYTKLLRASDIALYGRITYQLMGFWREILEHPSKEQSMNDFAVAMDEIKKIVFSRSLKNADWETAELASIDLEQTVLQLTKQSGNPVLVGSPGLIVQLTELNLIDEYQICIHPVIAGSGLILFKNISEQINLKFIKTKTFESGSVILYYERKK